jgi:hypothetical protein
VTYQKNNIFFKKYKHVSGLLKDLFFWQEAIAAWPPTTFISENAGEESMRGFGPLTLPDYFSNLMNTQRFVVITILIEIQ